MLRSADRDPSLPYRPFRLLGGAAIALAVLVLIGALFAAIAGAAVSTPGAGVPIDLGHLVRMTAIQAGLSTTISLAIGIALAWALNRLSFPGRGIVIGLFSSAIVTPGIIVAFGLLTVWGRAGWISSLWDALFHQRIEVPLFGLGGILAAHLILDGAFAARILLGRLDTLAPSRLKTARSLGLTPWQRFSILDWPALRGTLPGLAAIIFLLAFTSFPIVLLLGGGPANQTLEVAIYSAVRLDFNLRAAILLALTQVAICAAVIVSSTVFAPIPAALAPPRPQDWPDRGLAQLAQITILVLCVVGFALPLLATLAGGVSADLTTLVAEPAFWNATATSLGVAALSSASTVILSWLLASARAATASDPLRLAFAGPAFAYLAVPAVVLALGFFLVVRALGIDPQGAGPAVVVIANTLLALPFGVATLAPPLDALVRDRGRLIRALGMGGGRQLRFVEWPLLGREVGVVAALAFCFSLGDLGVISLFGSDDFITLPLLMVRALGAYRTTDAAAIAAIMLALAILVFAALPPIFARLSHART